MRRNRFAAVLLAVMPIALLSACAHKTVLGGDPGLNVVRSSEMPAPDRADLTGGEQRPYFVGAFDKLVIDVYGIEDLTNREVQVDASGKISFPLAGAIQVAGMTPMEIEAVLNDRLRSAHVRNPQATVNLKETLSQIVTIEGQVKKPGLYPVVGRMTLLGAIAKAEGTQEFAKLDDVVVYRTVKGQRLAALYDLDGIRHGAYPDPGVYPNDVITVGDATSRRLFKDLLTTFSLVSGPLIIAIDRLAQ